MAFCELVMQRLCTAPDRRVTDRRATNGHGVPLGSTLDGCRGRTGSRCPNEASADPLPSLRVCSLVHDAANHHVMPGRLSGSARPRKRSDVLLSRSERSTCGYLTHNMWGLPAIAVLTRGGAAPSDSATCGPTRRPEAKRGVVPPTPRSTTPPRGVLVIARNICRYRGKASDPEAVTRLMTYCFP